MSKEIAKSPSRTEVGPFDAKLLRGAANGLSPVELSRSVGNSLSPAECALRVREILSDKAFWNDPERKQLMLFRVQTVVEEMAEIASNSGDNQDYSTLIRAMDLLRKVLGEMEGTTEEEMRAMVRLQAGAMIEFMDTAMKRAKEILMDEYPEFDENVVEDAFETAMLDVRSSD